MTSYWKKDCATEAAEAIKETRRRHRPRSIFGLPTIFGIWMQGVCNVEDVFLDFFGLFSDSHIPSVRHASRGDRGKKIVLPDSVQFRGNMSKLDFLILSNIPRVRYCRAISEILQFVTVLSWIKFDHLSDYISLRKFEIVSISLLRCPIKLIAIWRVDYLGGFISPVMTLGKVIGLG